MYRLRLDLIATLALVLVLATAASSRAALVSVRYPEGSVQGFLSLRSVGGVLVGSGELTQTIKGDRVRSRLVFHFKDGSVDDDTTEFSQRGEIRLITDHHIQRGPAFSQPSDVLINVPAGRVTVRYSDHGKPAVIDDHMDLPADLANGVIFTALRNFPPDTKELSFPYLAATPKPRIVKLNVSPEGEQSFTAAGARYKALCLRAKVDIGGIASIVAPLIGKQPHDTRLWFSDGQVPAFVRSEGPLGATGPVYIIELSSPVWPRPDSGQ